MTKQQSRRLTGIRGKFLFGLAAILVFFSTLVAVTIYFFQKQALEDEAYRQASLIMTAMDASSIRRDRAHAGCIEPSWVAAVVAKAKDEEVLRKRRKGEGKGTPSPPAKKDE